MKTLNKVVTLSLAPAVVGRYSEIVVVVFVRLLDCSESSKAVENHNALKSSGGGG